VIKRLCLLWAANHNLQTAHTPSGFPIKPFLAHTCFHVSLIGDGI